MGYRIITNEFASSANNLFLKIWVTACYLNKIMEDLKINWLRPTDRVLRV